MNNKIREFIENNSLSFEPGNRNYTCVTLIGYSQHLGLSKEELEELLGKGRAKQGMHEGDLTEGELEVGQIVSEIKEILSCSKLVNKLTQEYLETKKIFF